MNTPGGEETILVEAQSLPPEERGAYLAQATGGDAVLRRRVEALLGGYKKGEFLEQAAAHDLRPAAPAPDPLTESPGDSIGRYKLLQQIGEGGCGVVYMAEQTEPVRRRVALKIIKLGMDTKSVIARFEAERQALALMDHPNIAKVLDAGATETGRPYFVMELVRGMKITDYCDEAKLSTRARLDLFVQVCQAVQHAHQKGIIHRDLKPSNVLVTVNDGQPVPKVIDFGVAKATGGQQLTEKTLFTAFEQFIGTPAYMSPEQAVLTSLDIDTRSDIYALGVLLYELLTGRTPFEARELLAIGLDEMRRTIREVEPARPSTRVSSLSGMELTTTAHRRGIGAPKLISELRGDLDWIVVKALEKDRARRYETANGMALDIQRHLNDDPVEACPPSRWYAFQKTLRRHKLSWAAGSAVFLALLIGLGASAWMFLREREAKREQVLFRQRADEQAATNEALNFFWLRCVLLQANSLSQAEDGFTPDPDLTVREALMRAAKLLDGRFKDQPLQEAAVRTAIGDALRGLGEPERGMTHLRSAFDIYLHELGPDDPETLAAKYYLALACDSAEKYGQARELYEEILESLKAEESVDDWLKLEVMDGLAGVYVSVGEIERGLSLYEDTLHLKKGRYGPNASETLGSMNNLAMGYQRAGKLAQAVAVFEEARGLMEIHLGKNHPFTLNAMSNLGAAYRDRGQPERALPLFKDVVERRNLTLGIGHPDTRDAMSLLAGSLALVGEYASAETGYRELLGHLRPPSGAADDETPALGFVLHHLADILRRRQKLDEAKSLAEEAVAAYERHLDWLPAHERVHAYEVLEAVLQDLGEPSEQRTARPKYWEALHKAAEEGDPFALNNLAWRLATSSDPSVRDGPKAVRFAEQLVAKTRRQDARKLDTLAAAYAAAGDFRKAAGIQREAIKQCQDEDGERSFRTRLKLYESDTPYREP